MLSQAAKSVLVIEGDRDTLTNLRDILEFDHYDVDEAMTVAEALGGRDWSRYLAILLDRQLPDGTAAELLPRLRLLVPDVPVIVVSEHGDSGGAIEAIRPHAIDYLPKPIDRDELLARLGRISMQQRLEARDRESERFFRAVFDSLSSPVAVLDQSGRILSVNRAWRAFAAANGGAGEIVAEGADYLEVCARAIGEDAETARTFAAGIKDVCAGRRSSFALEYPCHAPRRRRWFVGRVYRFQSDGPRGVVVSHIDITERKRAEEALRDAAARVQALSRRVVEVQEEERRHLARELHDEIGQVLSAISVNLHNVKGMCDETAGPRIEESIAIVDQATRQVHDLSLNLRPAMLDDLGLVATLRWYSDRQAQRAGFTMHFAAESSAARLHAELTIACFRAVQEALTNVVRHARARHVWVELRQDDDEVDLIIRDDGVGFDPETARRGAGRGESFGLVGIKERVELLGGRADIQSQPGEGTSVRVWFPVAPSPSAQVASEGSQR